jgi:hypothetical protein
MDLLGLRGPDGRRFLCPVRVGCFVLQSKITEFLMTTQSNRPQFLLLLRQPSGGTPAPDELQKIMVRFGAWMKAMRDKGHVLGTNGLDPTAGKVLRGPRGVSATDGPYPEAKEIVGGYVLITADNLEQAVELARECPGLDNQMAIEVRCVIQRS